MPAAGELLLAFSSNGFQQTSLTSALDAIEQHGFSGAEILFDKPHWQDSRIDKSCLSELQKYLETSPLKISNLNGNDAQLLGNNAVPEPRPVHGDESVRELVLDWHLHLIDIAQELGAVPLCFATGPLPSDVTEDEAKEQVRRHIEPLVAKADKLRQPIGIEFEPEHFVNSWAGLKPYLQEFESEYFGVNFDIGHEAVAGADIIESLKDARKYINNMHFEDIKDRVHIHLIPGQGDLPLLEILDYLEKTNYNKGLTVELYNHSHRSNDAIGEVKDYFLEHRPHLLKCQRQV